MGRDAIVSGGICVGKPCWDPELYISRGVPGGPPAVYGEGRGVPGGPPTIYVECRGVPGGPPAVYVECRGVPGGPPAD